MHVNEKSSGCGCGGGTTLRKWGGRTGSGGGCGCGCSGHECDGLTCSCRPRFFDGQLITAADFRRLDRYLIEKDRLHNRYLHGVGVVCGLEVVCNPCDDTVTVRTGYALGPCGEDIVVCSDTRVDVAALIEDHRRDRARSDCPPYGDRPADCEAARQDWVLGICYDEHPAGGVTSLKQVSTTCGCGGGCGGGCGCGGGGGDAARASCEPTQICEGYRFTLTKVDPGKKGPDGQDTTPQFGPDELPSRVLACLKQLTDMVTKVPTNPTAAELATYCCQLKADLRYLMETGSVHDCLLDQRLNAIVCPAPEDDNAAKLAQAAIAELFGIAIALFRMCVCSALLPPCGIESGDDCVPLAVLTVRTADLQVLEVCNWSARRFALTMPTLSYWLGWIPIFDTLRATIVRLCCGQSTRQFELDDLLKVSAIKKTVPTPAPGAGGPGGAPRPPYAAFPAGATGPVAASSTATVPAYLIAQYAANRSPISGLEATVLGALGAQDSSGNELASPLELENPLAALALGRLGFEAFEELVPEVMRSGRGDSGGDDEDRVAKLESELTKLQKKVRSQDNLIKKLGQERDQ